MATETMNPRPVLQQLKSDVASTKELMQKLKNPVSGPFKSKAVPDVSGKLENVALNTPLWFSAEALRPNSRSSSRFGHLSHNSFFSRHNPHPHRVTHIEGLNGIPICIVNDEWSNSSTQLPHPMMKSQFPTSVLGVPSMQMPLGDPYGNLAPQLGSASGFLSEAWREELRELAARVCTSGPGESEKKQDAEEPRRSTQYSAETGRLIPPSSRALTRHGSRQANRNNTKNKGKNTALNFQDQELMVLELLCQILQTDSLSAIQHWLLSAAQRDKELVMGMIQTATANMQLEDRSLGRTMEERLQSQMSQGAPGPASRDKTYGMNNINRSTKKQKQRPLAEDEKPERIGTAEVLQINPSSNEKEPAEGAH
ncbi:protein TBATA isoform X2 [Ambystoma mexicanum]|uniref:protein TBATA isoform X2 n=1 Tax=Ambystoma mexicanum TaxID=8296 RepID=UPI0037E7F399